MRYVRESEEYELNVLLPFCVRNAAGYATVLANPVEERLEFVTSDEPIMCESCHAVG